MSSKTAFIYHSIQGNTHRVAQMTARLLHTDLYRINDTDVMNANLGLMTQKIIRQMMQPGIFRQAIERLPLADYQRIILGCPCWNYTYSPAIAQFLELADYRDKEIVLLITHGGDIGRTIGKFQAAMKGGTYLGTVDFSLVKTMDDQELENQVTSKLRRFF